MRSLSVNAAYLDTPESTANSVVDYRDWQIPLGRRFRALKLWFVLRYFGLEGLRNHIRKHIAFADYFAGMIATLDGISLYGQREFNLVTFYCTDGNDSTARLMNYINESGKAYVTHTIVDDLFLIRVCVGQAQTELSHIDELAAIVRAGNTK